MNAIMNEKAPTNTSSSQDPTPILYKDINEIMRETKTYNLLTDEQKEGVRRMFPNGKLSDNEKKQARFMIEDIATGTPSLEASMQNWKEKQESELRAAREQGMGKSSAEPVHEATIEDLLESSGLTPEQEQDFEKWSSDGIEDELTERKAKWVIRHMSTSGDTFDDAVAAYVMQRQKLLNEGGFDSKSYSVTTGRQSGTGTVSPNTKPSTEGAEID